VEATDVCRQLDTFPLSKLIEWWSELATWAVLIAGALLNYLVQLQVVSGNALYLLALTTWSGLAKMRCGHKKRA